MAQKFGVSDLRGVIAVMPTPALPLAEDVRAQDTADLEETRRIVVRLIRDGVGGPTGPSITQPLSDRTSRRMSRHTHLGMSSYGRRHKVALTRALTTSARSRCSTYECRQQQDCQALI